MKIICINLDRNVITELSSKTSSYNIKLFPCEFDDSLQSNIGQISPEFLLIDFGDCASNGQGMKILAWIKEKNIFVPRIALVNEHNFIFCMKELKKNSAIDYILEKPLQNQQVITLLEAITQPQELLNPHFQRLYAHYDQTMHERINGLCTANQAFKDNPTDKTLYDLFQEVHKIAGSAGVYGYTRAGELSNTLQIKMDQLMKGSDFKNTNFDKEIKQICFQLQFREKANANAPSVKTDVSSNDVLDVLKGRAIIPPKNAIPIQSNPSELITSPSQVVTLTKRDVIIVDDDKSVLKYVKEVFSIFGYNVYCLNGGKQGLEFLLNCKDLQSCCMVILDLEMPDIDGLTIVKKLQNKFGVMRLVFLSSKFSPEIVEEVKKYGAFDFIQKPFNSNVMKEILKHK